MTDTDKFYETRREERRRDRAAAAMFVRACQTGDVEMMLEAVDQLNDLTVTGWTVAMRKLVREVSKVSPEIQAAFLPVWIESKMLPLRVYDHRALCAAVRVLLPQYRGPSVRVFRGAAANERRCRLYGLSWTTDIEVAGKFAGTDFVRQKRALKASFHHLLLVAYDRKQTPDAYLSDVAARHGSGQLEIGASLYDFWLDSLLETVKACDPEWSREVDHAWEAVMMVGIHYLCQSYHGRHEK